MLVKYFLHLTPIFFIYIILISAASAESEQLVVEIDNPKFSEKGLDDKIYEIKAKKGLKSDQELILFVVEGKFKSKKNGKWIYLIADEGNYLQSKSFISLTKNIRFYTDEGESLKSNYATFNMQKDIIELNDSVIHKNKGGIVIAENSTVTQNFNKIVYEGNVLTTLYVED